MSIFEKKYERNKDMGYVGAFTRRSPVDLRLYIPKEKPADSVFLQIHADGMQRYFYQRIQLNFIDYDGEYAYYGTKLDVPSFEYGLYYYKYELNVGDKTEYYGNRNLNGELFELLDDNLGYIQLLVYKKQKALPEWMFGGIMYHIFVDRFKKSGKCSVKDNAILNNDWYKGIIQYPEYPGAYVENNMFFGGNLKGIEDKLDYLEALGTKVIYLSPIFKAYSNHKYDTGDYMKIDEMFGGEEAFVSLLEKAKEKGISIILDGVFNHTGDDSLYFNKYRKYVSNGACNCENSKYRDWYNFKTYPCDYDSWWGIDILPKLNQNNEDCRNFFVGEGGVIEKYTKMGIGGWRLDVADELPDEFLYQLRERVHKNSDGQGIVIGEVWENAAVKSAYGHRKNYFHGRQLDSVMNYPLRNGIIDFVTYGSAELLYNVLVELYSSYPRCVSDSLMNILGTHDTERILTVLGDNYRPDASNDHLAVMRMSAQERDTAIQRLKMASILQYTVYGIPSVFYGDEAGLEGYHDPFCRRTYPWGKENTELLEHYQRLGELRNIEKALDRGDFRVFDFVKMLRHCYKSIVYSVFCSLRVIQHLAGSYVHSVFILAVKKL